MTTRVTATADRHVRHLIDLLLFSWGSKVSTISSHDEKKPNLNVKREEIKARRHRRTTAVFLFLLLFAFWKLKACWFSGTNIHTAQCDCYSRGKQRLQKKKVLSKDAEKNIVRRKSASDCPVTVACPAKEENGSHATFFNIYSWQ